MDWTPPWGEILEEGPFEQDLDGPSDGSPLADAFRQSMRRLAGGVCAVTVDGEGSLAGITASSVTSLSMTPPSLLVSIRRTSSIAEPLKAARRFTVHLLGSGQVHAAQVFAGRFGAQRRDAMVTWTAGPAGQRHLAGALSHVQCRVGQVIPIYSHLVVVGVVEAVFAGAESPPLIYFDGGFLEIGGEPAVAGVPR